MPEVAKPPQQHDTSMTSSTSSVSTHDPKTTTVNLQEMQELRESLAALSQQVTDFASLTQQQQKDLLANQQVSQLQTELTQTQQESWKLQQQLTLLQEQSSDKIAGLEDKQAELKERIAVLEADLQQARHALEQSQAEAVAAREQQKVLEQTMDQANKEHALEMERMHEQRDAQELAWNEHRAQLQGQLEQVQQNYQQSQQDLEAIQNECLAQSQENTELQENLGKTITEWQHKAAQLEAESAVQQQLLRQQGENVVNELQQQLSAKQSAMDELQRDLTNVQEELVEARREAESQLEQLQAELSGRIAELDRALADTMTELEASEKQRQELEQELEDNRMTEKARIQVLEQELMEEQQRVADLREASTSQQSKTTETLVQLRKELEETKARCHQAEDRASQLERDHRAAAKQLTSTESELHDALEHMKGSGAREEELFRKLRECDRIRRELHGKVMQLMGNIRVFVRVRPALEGEAEQAAKAVADAEGKKRKREAPPPETTLFRFPGIYDRQDKKSSEDITKNIVEVTEPYKDRGGLKERRKKWKFGFDNIFSPEHGQSDIWEATEPLVQSTIDGYNVTIFAYGQTGSGKTYTMLGDETNPGIIARAVQMLFSAKRETESMSQGETQVRLSVELLEVYNEQVRDLLAPNSGPNGREIPLKVTSKEVVGNIIVDTSTEDEVMRVMELAQSRRCVKATASNAESSRSHMLFTIHYEVSQSNGTTRAGKLNVCDLAGSERLNKSGTNQVGGALLKETKHINLSLSTLSNVIERLQAGDKNIPYRESKLTFLLQNSLGGNSKTLAIVCCNPLPTHFHESLCSLRFAEKVNKVDLKAVANFSC